MNLHPSSCELESLFVALQEPLNSSISSSESIVVSRNFIVRLVGPLGRNYLSIAGAGRLSNLQYSRYCFPDRTSSSSESTDLYNKTSSSLNRLLSDSFGEEWSKLYSRESQ